MELSSTSSSSRVKVEYSDPSGVYSLISDQLSVRLPLRNLHWNSLSRPLRSIDSLYVELVPDRIQENQADLHPASSTGSSETRAVLDSPGLSSNDVNIFEPSTVKRERRHQIPGLRQTPYLKIYFLHCDDTETYKASSRKLLREWIREHTPPSQSSTTINNQENHDAFEWLIVHVVIPDINNSTPPSQSSSARNEVFRGEIPSSSRWPSRSSLNLVDKIRADFNGSSKSSVDRVVQILAARSPQAQGASLQYGISQEDYYKDSVLGWADLLTKFKYLILASFDLRVGQYEEDIREKGSQRNIPGWNFCTFFVLKEGLARGFESVGLVEDALTGYDELSVELEAAIRAQNEKKLQGQHTGLFEQSTQELHIQAENVMKVVQQMSVDSQRSQTSVSILDSESKPFRELILANNISVFEFRCYLFARQLNLLLRLAKSLPPSGHNPAIMAEELGQGSAASDGKLEDLVVVAEACRRAVEFITSASSTLREDLNTSLDGSKEVDISSLPNSHSVVETLINSWTFTSCYEILARTAVRAMTAQHQLGSPDQRLFDEGSLRGSSPQASHSPGSFNEQGRLLARASSLPSRPFSALSTPRPEELARPDLMLSPSVLPSVQLQTGMPNLAAERANLLLVARQALSSIGARCGWKCGWSAVVNGHELENNGFEDISLNERPKQPESPRRYFEAHDAHKILICVSTETLSEAFVSRDKFYSQYEDLTRRALEHYNIASRQKSAGAMSADIAAVRFAVHDYAAAASYFRRMAPFYAENDWKSLEIPVLDMYAQCLKDLNRVDEYIGISLKMLAQIAQKEFQGQKNCTGMPTMYPTALNKGTKDRVGYLKDIATASKVLKEPISALMERYFRDVHIESCLFHFKEMDGFQLMLHLRSMIPEVFSTQQVKVRLVGVEDAHGREIWLTTRESLEVKPGPTKIIVTSNALIPGLYIVDKVLIKAENIIFTHDLSPPDRRPFFAGDRASTASETSERQEQRILVWPPLHALDARASTFPDIHLERIKSISVEVSSGSNDISHGEVLLRAGSAGLRLHTADADLVDGDATILDKSQPGVIRFEQLNANTVMKLKIPYRVDSEVRDIIVKLEVSYSTTNGDFLYACNSKISVLLPLGVNVQDIFKQDRLFSKFTISTAISSPLHLSDCQLEENEEFGTTSPLLPNPSLNVFVRQPVSMIYRISRKATRSEASETSHRRLMMHIKYRRLDDEVCMAVKKRFFEFLDRAGLKTFYRLLEPTLLNTLCTKMSNQSLELIAMLCEIDIGTFDEFDWEHVLASLPRDVYPNLVSSLQTWHEKYRVIALALEQPHTQARQITIPVDIPQMQVVHTVRLRLVDSLRPRQSRVAVVGKAVNAELSILHTRQWGIHASKSHTTGDAFEFYYEIDASTDTWLIGGQRKAQFLAKENEVVIFPVILLPQRAGYLMLPSVDVRPISEHERSDHAANQSPSTLANPLLNCEIDYRNIGETMLVVPNLSSTTVTLDPDGLAGGAWLVESERRQDVCSES